MACLRGAFIGSINAWLPSRRSVDSQRGAAVMLPVGQIDGREGSVTVARHPGRTLPWWVAHEGSLLAGKGSGRRTSGPRRGADRLDEPGLVAAAKQKRARHDLPMLAQP